MHCPQCGFKNLKDQRFCGECHADLMSTGSLPSVTIPEAVSSLSDVSFFPLFSLEVLHLEQLSAILPNPNMLPNVTRDLMVKIESQLSAQGATVESIRENILFFSLKQGAVLQESLKLALKLGVALAKKTIQVKDVTLRLKVGLDLANSMERSPMAAVSPRLAAQAGQLVVTQSVYQATAHQVPYQPLEPVRVQGSLEQFYVVIPGGVPAASAVPVVPAPVPVVSTPPALPKPPAPPAPAAPEPQVAQTPPPAPQPEPQPQPEPAPLPPVEAAPPKPVSPAALPVSPVSPSGQPEPRLVRNFEPLEEPGSEIIEIPPVVSRLPEPRLGSISYSQVLQILEQEIHTLTAAPEAKGKVIALTGDPGSGKSTILNMVRGKFSQDSLFWLSGSFYANTRQTGIPLFYWFELIQNLLGFPLEGAPAAQGEEHLANVLKSLFGENVSPATVDFVRTLVSLKPLSPIDASIRNVLGRTGAELFGILASMAHTRPLVLVLENLEYADPASLEVLQQLLQRGLLDLPVIIVLTYPLDTKLEGVMGQLNQHVPWQEYGLRPLDEATLVTMAEPPLAVPWKKLPDPLKQRLAMAGMPMYLEEAFRWLQLQGGFSVQAKTGKFQPEKKLKTLLVPHEVSVLVQERFDALDDSTKVILQVASAIGERFSMGMLGELTASGDQLEELLQFLWQTGFIVPDTPGMARFRHGTIWEVIYQSLQGDSRVAIHQRIVDLLQVATQKGISVSPLLMAHHALASGNVSMALVMWHQAGVWLAHVGSTTGANLAFQTVTALIGHTEDKPTVSQWNQLRTTMALINLDVAPEYARNLLLTTLADTPAEEPQEALQIHVFLAQAYEKLGNLNQATSTMHRAVSLLPPDTSPTERVALLSQEVAYLSRQGKFQEAKQVYHDDIAPLASATEDWADPVLRGSYLKGEMARIQVALMQADPLVLERIEAALRICVAHQDVWHALHLRILKGAALLMQGQYAQCQNELDPMVAEFEQLASPAEFMIAWGLVVLQYHMGLEDWENAAMLLPNIQYQAEVTQDYWSWCMCQGMAGQIAAQTGDREEAQKLLEKAVTTAAHYFLSEPALFGWQQIAENELALNQLEMAEKVVTQALDVSQKPAFQNRYAYYQLTLSQVRLFFAQNKLKEAGKQLEALWTQVSASPYQPIKAETLYLIGLLYQKLAQTVDGQHQARFLSQQQTYWQQAQKLWTAQGNGLKADRLLASGQA